METILQTKEKIKICNSKDIFDIIKSSFDISRELVYFIGVNSQNKIVHAEIIGIGGLNNCYIEPRAIFKLAFIHNCYGFFLAHNHPSGDITPSFADKEMTEKINKGSKILNLAFYDHIIFSNEDYYSMFDNNEGGF